jgi:hypothetical protein
MSDMILNTDTAMVADVLPYKVLQLTETVKSVQPSKPRLR